MRTAVDGVEDWASALTPIMACRHGPGHFPAASLTLAAAGTRTRRIGTPIRGRLAAQPQIACGLPPGGQHAVDDLDDLQPFDRVGEISPQRRLAVAEKHVELGRP